MGGFGHVSQPAGIPLASDPFDDDMLADGPFWHCPVVDELHFPDMLAIATQLPMIFGDHFASIPGPVLDTLETGGSFAARETGVSPACNLRKKAEKDLSNLRSICCTLEAFSIPNRAELLLRSARKCAHCAG